MLDGGHSTTIKNQSPADIEAVLKDCRGIDCTTPVFIQPGDGYARNRIAVLPCCVVALVAAGDDGTVDAPAPEGAS